MGKLIDADEVMNVYKKLPNIPKIEKDMLYSILEDIPTAYNVDKVVEQLEDLYTYYDNDYSTSKGNTLIDRNETIEIVKAGGKE